MREAVDRHDSTHKSMGSTPPLGTQRTGIRLDKGSLFLLSWIHVRRWFLLHQALRTESRRSGSRRTAASGDGIKSTFRRRQSCHYVVTITVQEQVTWVHSFVSQDKQQSSCIYDGSPEAISQAARRSHSPIEGMTEVRILFSRKKRPVDPCRETSGSCGDLKKAPRFHSLCFFMKR
jgi:Protein of unknown function (DUF4242)